jgi:hypothetical protein
MVGVQPQAEGPQGEVIGHNAPGAVMHGRAGEFCHRGGEI